MQTIKSIGVLSVAKISGAVYAVLGLLFAPMFLLIGTISSMAGQHPNPFGAIGGVATAVVLPVFYGVIRSVSVQPDGEVDGRNPIGTPSRSSRRRHICRPTGSFSTWASINIPGSRFPIFPGHSRTPTR
ncbi:MAG: hypothetical protein JWO91_1299 [Acidobacteriaceae bacterium]|nr:hypothetical protein [Acidobacteriaceae bacterium]